MKNLYILRLSILVLSVWMLGCIQAFAQVQSIQAGLWSAGATWNTGTPPTSAQTVTILHNVTVGTGVNQASSVTVQAGTLQFGTGVTVRTLTVANDFTIVSGGTVAPLNNSATHVLNVGGDFVLNTGGTFTSQIGTGRIAVTFNGGGAQQISGTQAPTFYNVSTTGGGTTLTLAQNTTLLNNLTVGNATTLNVPAFGLTVVGTTTVGGGTNGVLNITSAVGTRQFGPVVLNAGATWDNTGNSPVNFRGGINRNAAAIFNAGTGVQTFDTNSQALTGTFTIPNVTVTGVTLTNNNSLTVSTALSGTGTLLQAGSAVLDLGGTSGITTLTATNAFNSVNYTGAAQTVNGTNYYHLTLAGTGAKTLQAGTTAITGNLSLTGSASTSQVGALAITGNLGLANGTSMTLNGTNFSVGGQTFIGGGASGTLTLSAAGSKIFTGLVTIATGASWNNSGNSPVTFRGGITSSGTFTAGTGVQTFDTNPQALTGTFSMPSVTVTGVTLTNNNNLSVGTALSGTGTLTQALNAVLDIGGTAGITAISASSFANTVNYNGAAQTVHASNYWNLILGGTSAKTLQAGTTSVSGDLTMTGSATTATVGALAIGGNLVIGASNTFAVSGNTFTVTGTTSVGGTLSFTGAASTKTFTGLVTVQPGGTWSNTGFNSPVTFRGGITNNGTFNSGTGVYTFDTNSQSLNGTFDIPSITITGVTLNNTNSLTVNTALSGTGTLAQAANATLTIGGTSGITGLTASSAGNTVTYSGAAQTVHSNNYHHLILAGSGVKTQSAGIATIAGNLTLTGTATTTTAGAQTVSGNVSIGNGTTLTVSANPFTVTGTTTVGGGTSGSLVISGLAGAKTFSGAITIAAGGVWNNSGNSPVTIQNGITNNGTFTAGTGVYTFDTNAQALTGTFAVPNVTVTTITLTNNNSLTVSGALSGSGTLLQAANSLLDIGGTSGITALNATASGNTVNYTGAAQTVHGSNYANIGFSGSGVKTLQVGTTAITGNFTVGGTSSVTGVVGMAIGGNVVLNSGTFVGGAFTHSVGGNWTNNGGTFTHGGGIITFNGTTQTIGGSASTTFNSIATVSPSNTSTAISTTISGVLNVATGSTFTVGGFPLSVAGATNVIGTGNLVIASGTGTKIFTGLVTIAATASWTNSGNSAVTFRGGITNAGTFTAGSGIQLFDTNPQALTGNFNISNVTVNGAVLTNNNSLIVGNSLAGSGTLTQAIASDLTIGGGISITSLNATAASNTVSYSGSGQVLFPTPYENLNISQSSGTATLSAATSVNGTLTLTSGNLSIGSNNLLLGSAAVAVVGPSASKMIIASGSGQVQRTFTSTGSYTFPIGDDNGTLEYSPVTVNVTAGSFSSAYVGVSVDGFQTSIQRECDQLPYPLLEHHSIRDHRRSRHHNRNLSIRRHYRNRNIDQCRAPQWSFQPSDKSLDEVLQPWDRIR